MSWEVNLRGRVGDLDVDLAFRAGPRATVIVGPNGAGKTTLLRALAGAPLSLCGRATLHGVVLMDDREGIRLPPERRGLGYVPQGYALFENMTVLDNVLFGCRRPDDGVDAEGAARRALEQFEAAHLVSRYPGELSGGEKQRVALARALAPAPRGLLLDEPLAALDARNRRAMRTFLADYLNSAARPSLVVTHDIRDVLAIGGEVVVVEAGRVVQSGSLERVVQAPATEFVSELCEPLKAQG